MATPVEIVFVGLVTMMNLKNTQTSNDFPPPSAIVHKTNMHTPFIAFETANLSVTGATPIKLDTTYSMIMLPADGEELVLQGLPSGLPNVDSSVDRVASLAAYSRISSPSWDHAFVPKRMDRPQHGNVAAFMKFGGGDIFADRVTRLKYDFVTPSEQPSTANAKAYLRDVHYKFMATTTGLQIVQDPLGSGTKPTLDFQLQNGARTVKLWIGAATSPLLEITGYEPRIYHAGLHFEEYYKTETRPDDINTDPIPVPVAVYADGSAAPAQIVDQRRSFTQRPAWIFFRGALVQDPGGDPEVGYCGASQSGCNPCP